jgi:DNA-binding response OmpR family regulator
MIQTANGGIQALAMAQSEMPDLILLDVMMPDMDGFAVARRLRSDAATAGIPILMFTALGQIEDQLMGFEAGADGYLAKPTEPRELFAQIKTVLACAKRVRPADPTQTNRDTHCTVVRNAG